MSPQPLRVPLEPAFIRQGTLPSPRPLLRLHVLTGLHSYEEVCFLVDTGASISVMDWELAELYGIPVQGPTDHLIVNTTGGPVTLWTCGGGVRARVPIWSDRTFDWPCNFVQNFRRGYSLLGMAGVIRDLRLTIDGTPQPDALYGCLIVEPLR